MTDRWTDERLQRLEAIVFPVDVPELPIERETRLRREAEERCYDEQFQRMNERRLAEGMPPLSRSLWMAGFDDEEEPDTMTDAKRQTVNFWTVAALVAALALVGWAVLA